MKIFKSIFLSLCALLLSLLILFPLLSMEGAFYGYSSPLNIPEYPRKTGEKISNVLLILIDGLRADSARSLLSLKKIPGAFGTLKTKPPSWSNPCFANIITGTWQDFHSVTSNEFDAEIPVEHLFSFSSSSFVTAFSGDESNLQLIGDSPSMSFSPDPSLSAEEMDQLIAGKAIEFLSREPSFILVHLSQVDHYQHYYGLQGEPTTKALQNVDTLLGEILEKVDLKSYLVIVTSDHGHIDQGGHGGGEEEVLNTPFFLFGENVKTGVTVSGNQVDIAPTISLLSGAPIPRYCLGEPLWDAFDLSLETRGRFSLRLLEQRDKFASSFFQMLGGVYKPLNFSMLESSSDFSSVFGTAESLRKRIDSQIQTLKGERIAQERNSRLFAPVVCGILIIGVILFGLRKGWPLAFLDATIILILFLIFYHEGLGLSFSFSVLKWGSFLEFFLIFGLPLLLAEVIVSFLLPFQVRKANPMELAKFLQKSLFSVSLILLMIFSLFFYLNGMSSTWHLPDFDQGFYELALLLLIVWNGLFALLLPFVFGFFWKRRKGARG
ncbi:MAG: alkaline phosphatase family protein [Caldiserica bacterium]|jgi:hypothetical protein|nr:alkaline phosphatase family protein [Caldisericota bacterium]MDH7561768.1 alkaline phosphatase family protein [Caldisericota bacterium]